MRTTPLTELLVLGLLACSPAAGNEKTPAQRTLVAGTLIQATTQDSLSSRDHRAGETLTALVSGDVEDADGHVVIPAGSPVALRIVQLEPATTNGQRDGRIALEVIALTVGGQEYPVSSRVEPPHLLQARGGGPVIGTVVGRLIAVNSRAPEIGRADGVAAGTATARRSVRRDLVVLPGTAILFVLPQPLTVATR